MRHALRQKGVITSGLDTYQIQHERNLNTILSEVQYRPHIVEMIGEDLTFDLQGLLVDARGANLRNLIAHGLLDDTAYQNRQAIYLWWVTLHLCCLWYLTTLPEDNGSEDPENSRKKV